MLCEDVFCEQNLCYIRQRPMVTMTPAPRPQNWRKWLVLSLLGLALSVRPIDCDYSSDIEKFGAEAVARCNEKCPFQNRTGEGHFDLTCGSDCSMQQCTQGCSLWREGLESSCQAVCNATSETVFSRELYCIMGCNEALNTYLQKLRELIGTPAPPALGDSISATSLSLTWDRKPVPLGNLTYLVQWRYEELPGTWQYYSNTSLEDPSVIHVQNLQPYTKYRFRVTIFLSGRGSAVEPIHSSPSVVISTLESGRPSSPPLALRAAAPDSSRVAISWKPGPFPNGPLISYVLRLIDTQPDAAFDSFILDMPASNNTLFYMFQNLAPSREYEVSVAMRNAVGEGPRAFVNVSTPPLPTTVPGQLPVLILGGERNILAAPANDMLSDPVELYNTEYKINGVGLDISKDYLFVSVSNGDIYRSSLSKRSSSEPLLSRHNISYKPHDLSVDWLNKHLYILGEVHYNTKSEHSWNISSNWEIIRCDFDGKNQLVALSGFNSKPIHFEVDAYNGYLFWALRGVERGGLYRLDLANISNGVRRDTPPERIVRDANLGAFTVDYADFRILITHLRRNTVLAVSLDGREVSDFRSNTQTPMFLSAISIAYASGLFYWTNGKEMLTEEYHEKTDSYFHNEYPLVFNTKKIATRQVLVASRSSQPIPVPVNPPIGVQSVMGINRAKVTWSAPHLLGHQGSGAWQQWEFRVRLTHIISGDVIDRYNVTGYTLIVENLQQDAEYAVKVAAVTQSGQGPWSSEFVGRTLSLTSRTLKSTLLWSGPDGLLQTNLTGDDLRTLIHKEELKNFHITGISWYQDKLYLVTNVSTVMWYNLTSMETGFMKNMDNVGSLAVDWVGKRIYWSNPKQQLITRGNLDGGSREPVSIMTIAKELAIDSMNAYIYWSTGHAVEAARLNGENKMIYYPAQLFSGKQVMGITTDLENRWLYWLVRSYDGSELHRAPTAERYNAYYSEEMGNSLITRLPSAATIGPLCYFSGRLIWVQDAARAVVSDLEGKYTAELVSRVHVIAVRDPTLHNNSDSLIAIPETVNESSVAIVGVWNQFNVTWAPVTRVNVVNSRVYYEVNLNFEGKYKIEKNVATPWLEVTAGNIPPYTPMEVTVRAATVWGGGGAARVFTHSPQAPPSPPQHPRLYLEPQHSGGPLTAIFRWEPPRTTNGVIRGYEVYCWTALASDGKTAPSTKPACPDTRLPRGNTQLTLKDLVPASKYYFQVRAYTDAGFGDYSESVSSFSEEVNPVPRVMISSHDSIRILDLDSSESVTVPKSTGIPIDFDVAIEEQSVYWANNLEEFFSSRINGDGHYKLRSINGVATSICVDWVGRFVYWTQLELTATASYVTYRADIGLPSTNSPSKSKKVFASKRPVYNLQVVPKRKSLFWYEESEQASLGKILTSETDGSKLRTFFRGPEKGPKRDVCNCPENPQVSRAFVIDMTTSDIKLYWVDPWTHRIIASDLDACKCKVVLDASEKKKYGFLPTSITVDSKHIYWFNSTEKTIFYTNKNEIAKIEQIKSLRGYKIKALDVSSQPYPPKQCLFPKHQSLEPLVIDNSAHSITLELPRMSKPEQCKNREYELTATEYTVLYRPYSSNDTTLCHRESCSFLTTNNNEVILNNLKPFTNYSVVIEATNYYAKRFERKPIIGSSLILQTAADPPTPPVNVKVTVLSPVSALVEWTPDPSLWYELHWRTDDTHSQHKVQEHTTFGVLEGRSANMTHLTPGTSYLVWVRARSNHSIIHADSATVTLRTFPSPAPIAFSRATAYSLLVLWPNPTSYELKEYHVEFTDEIRDGASVSATWSGCVLESGGRGEWNASGLRPRTRYRFRLRLRYVPQGPYYYWPHDERFTYETLGDVPARIEAIHVEALGDRVVRVKWEDVDDRGDYVTMYRVWGRGPALRTSDDIINENSTQNTSQHHTSYDLPPDISEELKDMILREGWQLLYNGSEKYWLLGGEDAQALSGWSVCVQARNSYGWGELSDTTTLDVTLAVGVSGKASSVAVVAAIAALCLAVVTTAALLYAYNNRSKKKAALVSQMPSMTRRGPDVELATLRQLPIQHSNNILYNQGVHSPTDAELGALPHIRRSQITLSKFLGAGAFGEVFEGIARHVDAHTQYMRVAVKTLRKGATDQEKGEFLKEAALMSNFKHEHILRLIGVCLDNDPNYIIMELMEAGDLLSYLRAKRTSLYTPESLTLRDLLNMCVDVTKGCRYLEEMHFVHRDLACRNCLVTHRSGTRVVKIGDFGLARDVYRNDYYRKKGEGMLPLRWMAVECLIDGVFSCQSDVWAWGVLCWEVLTLGQQPYPARTNHQVLEYVRAGGTPDRPPNCPSLFYELLQKCWNYNPEQRPSFRQCLEVVIALRDKTSPNITLTANTTPAPHHYLTLLADREESPAVDNRTYLLDENDNACDEDFSEQHLMEPTRLLSSPTTKYLELMYDTDSEPTCDGYEIPRTSLPYSARHSIIGVAPNRLIKHPIHRTRSLRTYMRPPNATILPLRNGVVKRASFCDDFQGSTFNPTPCSSSQINADVDREIFKTPF